MTVSSTGSERADVRAFSDQISRRDGGELGGLFAPGVPVHIARAPGRLDVMGGIADYSGALVLEATLAEATVAGAQVRADRVVRVRSLNAAAEGLDTDATFALDDLLPAASDDPYSGIRARFRSDRQRAWAAYVAGAFSVLAGERIVPGFERGATIAVRSDVPLGAGVSSSAALEVASLLAICAAFGIAVDGMRLARLCQIVENAVVGAPCGIMDQVTSALGAEGKLLALRCQPHELDGLVDLPPEIRAVGFDTNVKHVVGGSRYTDTRVAAFMGQRIIAERIAAEPGARPGSARMHLASITPDEYARRWRDILPARLSGAEFIERYLTTNDPVTKVDPAKTYLVRSRTEHPIYENARVERFRERLRRAATGDVHREMIAAGRLMFASDWSYGSRCGMGSKETDFIVKRVRKLGPDRGFYGAKITGGGSGGTVAILCRAGTDDDLRHIAAKYAEWSGRDPRLFVGSGPGALEYGTRTVVP